MRYEILGPLRVADGDRTLSINARNLEVLLATLLIKVRHVVSLDQLIAEIWCDGPPRRATAALYVYVSQLRKLLDCGDGAPSTIVTRSPGYLMSVPGTELDLEIFQRLVQQGRVAARQGRHEDAAAAFSGALDLWRGPALIDMRTGPIIAGFVASMEEARLECAEKMVASGLEAGHHRELIPRLFTLVAEHPLHEAFYRQLMLALYRSERRGDALQVYRSARTVLHDELGLEPGRALRDLHHRILTLDDQLDRAA
jgi:DNA-binding SARP family transcriptional activator